MASEAVTVESEKIQRQPLTGRHVMTLITCMLGILGPTAIIYTAAGLCYRPVSQQLGVQVSDVSLYITMVYLANLFFAIPGAKIFDKFNVKIVAAICSCMVAIPYFCMSLYTEIWMWWIAGLIIGAGLVVVEFVVTAGVLGKWFHTKYGFVIGLCFAMTGVGGVIFNLIGQVILGPDLTGWRSLYQIFGIVIFLTSVPWQLMFLKRTPQECGLLPYGMPLVKEGAGEDEYSTDTSKLPGYTRKECFHLPFFWVMVLAGGLINTITTMSQLFAVYVQWLGHDGWGGAAIIALLALSGTLESFASAGQGLGKIIIGAIESWNLKAALIVGASCGVIGLLMIWFFPLNMGEKGIWPMFFGGAVYGLCYALSTAMLPFMVREIFGSKDYDSIYSVVIAIFNGIGALGATGWAIVEQSLGWDAFFIGGMIDIAILFCLFYYVATVGDKARRETWYTPDIEFSATGRVKGNPELQHYLMEANQRGEDITAAYQLYLAQPVSAPKHEA